MKRKIYQVSHYCGYVTISEFTSTLDWFINHHKNCWHLGKTQPTGSDWFYTFSRRTAQKLYRKLRAEQEAEKRRHSANEELLGKNISYDNIPF